MTRLSNGFAVLASTLFSMLCCFISPSAEAAEDANRVLLKGQVNSFGVLSEEVQSDLGFRATADGKNIRVEKVRLGTEAYYRGIAEGDRILSAKANGQTIEISIDRNGQKYTAKLKWLKAGQQITANLTKPVLSGGTKNTQLNGDLSTTLLTGKVPYKEFAVDAKNVQALAQYNFQIIMDRSLSMREKDCPGDLSRWDWCAVQTTEIAKALSPYMTSGLTLVPFNHGFDVFDKASPQNIVDVFNDKSFILGTRLYEPLSFLLERYFKERSAASKPLLIVVITDGEPWPSPEPVQVKDELVSASSEMHNGNEVIVVFLQIGGNDRHGRNYLVDLGDNLVSYGAKYQYVHTVTFETLEATGLAQGILDTVKKYGAVGPIAQSKPKK